MSAARSPLRAVAAIAALAGLQAGCAQPPQAAAGPRLYAVDVQGRSALCETPRGGVSLAANKPTEAAIIMDNDGGWCGIATNRTGPGLVLAKPANGRLNVRKVGATTRVDYIPDRGFVGTDSFAVRLLPDQSELKVTANVQGSPTQQVAAAPAEAPVAAPAPAKRAAASAPVPARKGKPAQR